jgi:hypothetical protein
MEWNWQVVSGHLLGYGLPIVIGAVVVVSLAWAVNRFQRKKVVPVEPRKKTFLEEALDADVERPQPLRTYTWAEFQADLHDGTKTFEEIYEKYGGVFPKKPEDPPPSTVQGFQGPMMRGPDGIQGFQGLCGADGTPGVQAPTGVGGPEGPEGRCPQTEDQAKDHSRMKELQEWFKKRGEEATLKNLVPPPPAPHTVIHKIYTRGRR